MDSNKQYLKRLERLLKRLPISFQLLEGEAHIYLNSVPFKYESTPLPALFALYNYSGKGIFAENLNPAEIKYCEAEKISYFTTNPLRLCLHQSGMMIIVEPKPRKKFKKKEARQPISKAPETSLYISPNGFRILDVLFRIPESNLEKYKSALSFSKAFNLNQPRISKMLNDMKVDTIRDLRIELGKLPINWWLMAFADNTATKVMSKFFDISKPHYSLMNVNYKEVLNEIYTQNLYPGPLEVAKKAGYLRDEDISIWGNKDEIFKLKTKFKLIPGVDKSKPTWHLATPKFNEARESLSAQISEIKGTSRGIRSFKTNLFRTIWDLGFGTERLKELQSEILREVLNEL